MMRIDRRLIEAVYDSGASAWQTLWNVIVPLSNRHRHRLDPVVTIVMGDFITFDVMGANRSPPPARSWRRG